MPVSWFGRWLRRPSRVRPHRTRPGLQGLEDRTVPSTVVALSTSNRLLTFDSATPGHILSARPVTGLASGESLHGLDVRPATGELYALGNNRLYVIDPNTGVATLKAALAPDLTDTTDPFKALTGTDFGIDFNPAADRLRVVSDTDQNLRIHPDTGRVFTDTPLAYASGDVNAGVNPSVVEVAYTSNTPGAATTTLFGIETARRRLIRQGGVNGNPSPNLGQLSSVATFGSAGLTPRGFDIAPGGTAYVMNEARTSSRTFFALSTLDLASGQVSSLGYVGDGQIPIRDVAVLPSVQLSASLYAVNESAGTATIQVTRTDSLVGTIQVDYTTRNGTAVAGLDYLSASGTIAFKPEERTKTFTVPILNDSRSEGDETIHITLSNPRGGGAVLGASAAVLRINASDRTDTTGPVVTRVGLTGPSRGITGAIIYFNEDLDPDNARDLDNYTLTATGTGRPRELRLKAAAYDPVARAVTLVVAEPFGQTQFRKLAIEVNGDRGGLTDVRGNLLDGNENGKAGGDAEIEFQVVSGTTLTFTDRDGDRVTLRLQGGGRLDAIVPTRAPRGQNTQFWLVDPVPVQSSLTGSITRGRSGDGTVVIAELIGLDHGEFTSILSNPVFRVNRLTFSANATGL